MNATVMVHWPGQTTAACENHARKLEGLAGFLGFPLTSTPAPDGTPCANCENEAKKVSA